MKSRTAQTVRWLRLHAVRYGWAVATLCMVLMPYLIRPHGAEPWPTP